MIEFVLAVVAVLVLLLVIGLPVVTALGARGFSAIALTPAAAVTVIGGTAIIAGLVNVRWSILPVLAMTILAALVFGAITRRRGTVELAPRSAAVWIGAIVAAIVIGWQMMAAIGEPTNLSQTYDNIFHLNAVRWALDQGTISSLEIGLMTNPGGDLAFYPAGWHAVVALVAQLTGVSIPVAVNAFTFVISAVIWPLGALFLARTLFGARPVLLVAVGVLSTAWPVFPLLPMVYGVLYPYQLGLALVPVVLALTAHVLGIGAERPRIERWQPIVVLVALLGGTAIAHPGAFMAWLALSVPLFAAFAVRLLRRGGARTRVATVVGIVAYLGIGLLLVKALRPPLQARFWPPTLTLREAGMQVLAGGAYYGVPALLVALAVILGVVAVVLRRRAAEVTLLSMYLIAAVLYIAASALGQPQLRDALVGSWYNNAPRLAALLALGGVPLAALGIDALAGWLARVPGIGRRSRVQLVVTGAVVAALGVLGTQVGPLSAMPDALTRAQSTYADEVGSALLDDDEQALLGRLDQHVPEGVAVAGSPWTGTQLAYAIAERPVLMPHLLMAVSKDVALVVDELRDAEPGSAVCGAVSRLNVGFVLDFGAREVHNGHNPYAGLTDLADSDAVELVDEQGAAKLYRIVGCD